MLHPVAPQYLVSLPKRAAFWACCRLWRPLPLPRLLCLQRGWRLWQKQAAGGVSHSVRHRAKTDHSSLPVLLSPSLSVAGIRPNLTSLATSTATGGSSPSCACTHSATCRPGQKRLNGDHQTCQQQMAPAAVHQPCSIHWKPKVESHCQQQVSLCAPATLPCAPPPAPPPVPRCSGTAHLPVQGDAGCTRRKPR